MAIHQTKGKSDLEKRFRQLRQQVYGQQTPPSHPEANSKSMVYSISSVDTQPQAKNYLSASLASDQEYLYQSITKIIILSAIAVGAQLLLYFLSKNNLVNLSF